MKKIISIVVIIVAVFFLFSSFYIVNQTQQAVVLRFGQIQKVKSEPGLGFKTPFVDNVVKFEKRIMLYDIKPERVITLDKKTIVVDTYALWKIEDAKKFIESMNSVQRALTRIDDVVYSHVRDIIAKYNFTQILSVKRSEILKEITSRSRKSLQNFGIYVQDVRVKRTDLPPENTQSVYNRMKAERYSIAELIRAEGQREAQKTRAEADKQVKIILSDAQRKSEIIKGTADASVITILANAFGEDKDFFELMKITDMYKDSFKDSILVIPQDSPILKYFKEVNK